MSITIDDKEYRGRKTMPMIHYDKRGNKYYAGERFERMYDNPKPVRYSRRIIFWILVILAIGFICGMEYSSWQLRRISASEITSYEEGSKANGVAGYQGTESPEIMTSDLQTEAAPAPPPTVRLRITHYYSKSYDKNTAANEPLGHYLMLALAERMNLCGIAAISPGPSPLCKSWYDRVKTGDYPIVEILSDDPGGAITAGRYLICDRCPELGILDIYTGTEDVDYQYAYYSDVVEIESEGANSGS